MTRCSICDNPIIGNLVNPLIDEDMKSTNISRYGDEAGIKVSPEVINRHRKHYQKRAEPMTTKRDAAVIIKRRILDAIDKVEAKAGPDSDGTWILDKDMQPSLRTALAAQKTEDERERAKTQKGTAELAFAIIAMLGGAPTTPALELDDGLTIEGEFEDLDG